MHSCKYLYSEHWDGARYRRVSFPQYSINMRFIKEFSINGDESVLDIGCGNGDTTREIAKLVTKGNVLGIDASASMIAEALKTQSLKNLTFKLMNAHDIDFNVKFNVITTFFCMQWVEDKVLVFSKIQRALKSDGRFYIVAPMPHPHLPALRNALILKPEWKTFFSNYKDPLFINDNDYESYAEKAKLTVIKSHHDIERVYFSNYDSFFEFMCEMTPHLKQIPSSKLKNNFMHELLKEYAKIYPPNINGEYQLDFNLQKLICFNNHL